MPQFLEKRNFKRTPADLSLRFLNLDSHQWRLARTYDVSAKGVSLFTDEELLPQTSLDLWLHLPNEADPLYARGEVAWSRSVESHKYKAGVHLSTGDFVGISRLV